MAKTVIFRVCIGVFRVLVGFHAIDPSSLGGGGLKTIF